MCQEHDDLMSFKSALSESEMQAEMARPPLILPALALHGACK